jgi:CheY-like chemotaxis protein
MVGNLVAEVHALLASSMPQTARADWILGVCQKGTMITALVVDDSLLIRHTVCRLLEKHGYSVESACDGLEALEMLKRIQPSLIVTDLLMPKMGGPELIGILKQNPETASIPIIVVAGHKSTSQPPEETAADYIIFKDIDIVEQLEKTLDSLSSQTASV